MWQVCFSSAKHRFTNSRCCTTNCSLTEYIFAVLILALTALGWAELQLKNNKKVTYSMWHSSFRQRPEGWEMHKSSCKSKVSLYLWAGMSSIDIVVCTHTFSPSWSVCVCVCTFMCTGWISVCPAHPCDSLGESSIAHATVQGAQRPVCVLPDLPSRIHGTLRLPRSACVTLCQMERHKTLSLWAYRYAPVPTVFCARYRQNCKRCRLNFFPWDSDFFWRRLSSPSH